MALTDDLGAAGQAAAPYGAVGAVLAAEIVSGSRAYLVSLGEGEERGWLALDAELAPIQDRELVREVASIVFLSELAAELAGGGQLEELRSRLAQVRIAEQPEGIEEAEEAALELERTIGSPPVLASAAYLDAVGAATRRLESTLGEHSSPFAAALASSSATVEAFVGEVESGHVLPLR
jgi:hypothetical protein